MTAAAAGSEPRLAARTAVRPGADRGGEALPRRREKPRTPAPDLVSRTQASMGGLVGVHLGLGEAADPATRRQAVRDADRVLDRVAAWAARLTRFTRTSDLSRLNADARNQVPVRPTLAALLDWGREAEGMTGGIVDIALLDARLAAEVGDLERDAGGRDAGAASRAWAVDRLSRGSRVRRRHGVRFDLDGVAKGWLADRAVALLGRYHSVAVDADGDLAIRLGPGRRWRFRVLDPRDSDARLIDLELAAAPGASRSFGLATSGTSIHRWVREGVPAHHLIDPRPARPAVTDIVQATVVASSAREAEIFAKAAVILGSDAALAALDRPGVLGAIVLTERGELLLTPGAVALAA